MLDHFNFTFIFTNVFKGGMESETESQKLVVCNAHMHWDPEFSDVKMIQTFLLTSEMDRIIKQMGISPREMPVIMCGDYNSLPGSGVADFIKDSRVSLTHTEFRNLQYNKKLVKMNPKNGEVNIQII
jgi:CCR4-NOT transcription complex subunit 6